MRWIYLLAALTACSDRGTFATMLDAARADVDDHGPDVLEADTGHHDQAVDALCRVVQDDAVPGEQPMPPSIYRAINQTPIPNAAWARIRFSTDVAEHIVMPPAGLASYTISLWVYFDSSEIVTSASRRILTFGHANVSAAPLAELYTSFPSWPQKDQKFAFLMQDNAGNNLHTALFSSSTYAPDTWHHIAVVYDEGVSLTLYVNGAVAATTAAVGWVSTNANTDAVSGAAMSTGAEYDGPFTNIGIFDRAWPVAEVIAIAARGRTHYYSEPDGGDWPGETPPVEWSGPTVDGVVPNAGTGGDCTFGTGHEPDPFWGPALGRGSAYPVLAYDESSGPPVSVAKYRETRRRYPPIHHWLKTTGTGASRFALLSPIISRGFFPNGGGFGQSSLSLWLKRPAVPAATSGTLVQIGSGNSFVTVTVGPGEVPTVAVTDGTNTVDVDLPAWALDRIRHLTLAIDADLDSLKVYIDGVEVGDIDTSTVTPPDADVELEFTVGANIDGTDPLDTYFNGLVFWSAEVVTVTDVQGIVEAGWTWDVRDPYPIPGGTPGKWNPPTPDNPTGTSPVPDATWRDEVIDGVVPGASEGVPPLVQFEATWETEASTLHCWVISTHRLAVSSTAWWDAIDYDPSSWILSYATSGHADIFGEVPRVVKVTDDPITEALLLDVDAALQPGIEYSLVAPADLVGETP